MEDILHPQPSPMTTTSDSRSIIGASSGLEQTTDDFVPSQDGDLPMIVWLRGDELYVDEFCLDADAAMKALGIKRSRLTQISGKELRVGRCALTVIHGRFTAPVISKRIKRGLVRR